ncbi:MAG: alanine-glyoxylate transaminase/serine-glyoxylate transaminase/serine-pyruvate transaminase [Planctomycetota bacterium]|jgi:alanine-glyoxylate transaminase/serine-glyoxylate transaminase/serine-pyruvate transaminase
MTQSFLPVSPPERVLLGPGPSGVAPSVLRALSQPTIGHLDPSFLEVMDQIRVMLRAVFQTENELTLPMSGTGSAGMETCMVNTIEPGDSVLVAVNGVFGTRMAEVARRCGAQVTEVAGEWGRAFDVQDLRKASAGNSFKLIAIVHAETSTGVLQDLGGLREMADECGALLMLDCVTSLGGLPVELDRFGVDVAYSGTQKCLSCPPGLSPISFSARASDVLKARKTPVQSWYLDLSLISNYWGSERAYHHTAPINMLYGLHEALRLVLLEGLPERAKRHEANARALIAGLQVLGLEARVPSAERLAPLTAVSIPDGIDDARLRSHLLRESSLEIGGGLGPMKGRAWRIGLMGAGSTRRNVMLCLTALRSALSAQGRVPTGDALAAAEAAYN